MNILLETPTRNFKSVVDHEPKTFSRKDGKIDLTPFLHLPQYRVAELLDIRNSTFCKIWKRENPGRRWPHREIKRVISEKVDMERSYVEKILRPAYITAKAIITSQKRVQSTLPKKRLRDEKEKEEEKEENEEDNEAKWKIIMALDEEDDETLESLERSAYDVLDYVQQRREKKRKLRSLNLSN